MEESDEDFWESIAEFDVNGDHAVDRIEYNRGLRKLALEKVHRFFLRMDKNSDGHASQDEAPSLLWKRWITFDTNGDGMLDIEEYVQSQLPYINQNDER